jgi:hypothetical protein
MASPELLVAGEPPALQNRAYAPVFPRKGTAEPSCSGQKSYFTECKGESKATAKRQKEKRQNNEQKHKGALFARLNSIFGRG